MNTPEATGTLVDGRTYRATSYVVEIADSAGAVIQTVDSNDIKEVQRKNTTVRIKPRKGKDLVLQTASIDDAGRLEAIARSSLAQTSQPAKRGGIGRALRFGCGGLIALVVLVIVIVAVSSAGGSKSNSKSNATGQTSAGKGANVGQYSTGGSATSKELAMTLTTISDPYTSPNQFTQPKAGNRFVVYHVTAKDVDTRPHTVNEFSFKLKTDDNHVYDPSIVVTSDTGFKAFNLSTGEITEGDVAFEVPQGAKIVELKYDNGIGSDDLFWRP